METVCFENSRKKQGRQRTWWFWLGVLVISLGAPLTGCHWNHDHDDHYYYYRHYDYR